MPVIIEKVMTKNVVTTRFDATLLEIRDIFTRNKFHHILVLDQSKKLAGIISDRDILKHISPFLGTYAEQKMDKATLNKPARQLMTPNPITIYQDETIPVAADVLVKNNLSALPVLDRSKQLVGILSWKDILRLIAKSK